MLPSLYPFLCKLSETHCLIDCAVLYLGGTAEQWTKTDGASNARRANHPSYYWSRWQPKNPARWVVQRRGNVYEKANGVYLFQQREFHAYGVDVEDRRMFEQAVSLGSRTAGNLIV